MSYKIDPIIYIIGKKVYRQVFDIKKIYIITKLENFTTRLNSLLKRKKVLMKMFICYIFKSFCYIFEYFYFITINFILQHCKKDRIGKMNTLFVLLYF